MRKKISLFWVSNRGGYTHIRTCKASPRPMQAWPLLMRDSRRRLAPKDLKLVFLTVEEAHTRWRERMEQELQQARHHVQNLELLLAVGPVLQTDQKITATYNPTLFPVRSSTDAA